MKTNKKLIKILSACAALFALSGSQAFALSTITGQVVGGHAVLISGSASPTTIKSVSTLFKITFDLTSSGSNIELCVGTMAQFNNKTCGTQLVETGTQNLPSLVVIDQTVLSGNVLYVINNTSGTTATYTFTIE